MPSLDRESLQLINAMRTLGGTSIPVRLTNDELLCLFAVAAGDLELQEIVADYIDIDEIRVGYYNIPIEWFSQELESVVDFKDIYFSLRESNPDFPTYAKCLAELHKRRIKFDKILQYQPLSEMIQVVPRCLLEYGLIPSQSLASWLVWRKWIYDIDNRSAQETGYLFEPILTASIGGVSYSASKSPVRRKDNSTKGRQVDCVFDNRAYEFKMRVTIAASGQGRFKEELNFAEDCQSSKYIPVLLVLDPTHSDRLDELSEKYEEHGGFALTGNSAWDHIEEMAGSTMSRFVNKYVRIPLADVTSTYTDLLPLKLDYSDTTIFVHIGTNVVEIIREDPS